MSAGRNSPCGNPVGISFMSVCLPALFFLEANMAKTKSIDYSTAEPRQSVYIQGGSDYSTAEPRQSVYIQGKRRKEEEKKEKKKEEKKSSIDIAIGGQDHATGKIYKGVWSKKGHFSDFQMLLLDDHQNYRSYKKRTRKKKRKRKKKKKEKDMYNQMLNAHCIPIRVPVVPSRKCVHASSHPKRKKYPC